MSTDPKWLAIAARRSAERSWSLGLLLSEHAQLEGLSDQGIADELGCDINALRWLSLCRRPSAENFARDIQTICQRFKVNALKLASIARGVEVLGEMRKQSSIENRDMFLLAARDRDEERDQ